MTRFALVMGDAMVEQKHRDGLRRIGEQMQTDLAVPVRRAAQHRTHEPRAEALEQPHGFERQLAQRDYVAGALFVTEQLLVRLAFPLDLVVAREIARFAHAEPHRRLALCELIVLDPAARPSVFAASVCDLLPRLDLLHAHDPNASLPRAAAALRTASPRPLRGPRSSPDACVPRLASGPAPFESSRRPRPRAMRPRASPVSGSMRTVTIPSGG